MARESVKFIRISPNEVKFDYKGIRFILEEEGQGVYAAGKAVILKRLNGTTKEYMKVIGWTKTDNNHGEEKTSNLLKGIVLGSYSCNEPALKYVKSLID